MSDDINPYTYSSADLVAPEAPEEQVLAERLQRLFAVLLDGLVVGGPLGLLAIPLALLLKSGGSRAWLAIWGGIAVLYGLGWVVYNLRLMSSQGQTWGKKQLGVRVVRTDGSPVSLARWILLRQFATGLVGWIPFVGPFLGLVGYLLIFRVDRRCLHDLIADTKVVVA